MFLNRPLVARTFALLRASPHPRLRSVLPHMRLTGCARPSGRARPKPPSSLTLQTSTPTDGFIPLKDKGVLERIWTGYTGWHESETLPWPETGLTGASQRRGSYRRLSGKPASSPHPFGGSPSKRETFHDFGLEGAGGPMLGIRPQEPAQTGLNGLWRRISAVGRYARVTRCRSWRHSSKDTTHVKNTSDD